MRRRWRALSTSASTSLTTASAAHEDSRGVPPLHATDRRYFCRACVRGHRCADDLGLIDVRSRAAGEADEIRWAGHRSLKDASPRPPTCREHRIRGYAARGYEHRQRNGADTKRVRAWGPQFSDSRPAKHRARRPASVQRVWTRPAVSVDPVDHPARTASRVSLYRNSLSAYDAIVRNTRRRSADEHAAGADAHDELARRRFRRERALDEPVVRTRRVAREVAAEQSRGHARRRLLRDAVARREHADRRVGAAFVARVDVQADRVGRFGDRFDRALIRHDARQRITRRLDEHEAHAVVREHRLAEDRAGGDRPARARARAVCANGAIDGRGCSMNTVPSSTVIARSPMIVRFVARPPCSAPRCASSANVATVA